MTRAYIGLGANLGDPAGSIAAAIRALDALPGARVAAVSRLYATAPVGPVDQPEFRNAVVALDLAGRGEILFVAALTQVLGAFVWGPSDRIFGRYKAPVLLGTAMSFVALVLLAAVGVLPPLLLLLVFALLGFSTGMVPVVMAHGRSLVPPHLLGRTITLLNIGTMGGGFLVQFISGVIIDLFPSDGGVYPLAAYQLVFALQAVLVLVGGIAYFSSKDSYLERPAR